MKKFLISILFLAGSVSLFAQEQAEPLPGRTDNMFLSYNAGINSVINRGMNQPTFNMQFAVGQEITPTWAWRLGVGGFWKTLEAQKTGFSQYNKPYVELNGDAILNLRQLFGCKCHTGYAFNFYIFAGPQVNFSSAVSLAVDNNYAWKVDGDRTQGLSIQVVQSGTQRHYTSEDLTARVAITGGVGFSYRVSDLVSLNAEFRYIAGPSIFGWASDYTVTEHNFAPTLGIRFHL